MEIIVNILNESGLHARPAGIFVKTANAFKSEVDIEFNGSTFNAKSIMILMSMGLRKDNEIKIIANDPDENEAVNALVELVENKFDEA